MTLARRAVFTALIVAVPAAALVLMTLEWRRAEDRRALLTRVAASYLTDVVREACESDSQWFLAGPRTGRPSREARQMPDADVLLPRPSTDELPFEVFPYDDQFAGTSTASPRFPAEFRRAMRASPPERTVIGSYAAAGGTGLQLGQLTGWTPGPCAALLFRLPPADGLVWQRAGFFAAFTAVFFVSILLAFSQTLRRVRRLTVSAEEAAKAHYASIAPDRSKDEISGMAFIYNEAATEIHRRGAETKDRAEALRRHLEATTAEVGAPLGALEARLAAMTAQGGASADFQLGIRAALQEAHNAVQRLENLAAAAELRLHSDPLTRDPEDLGPIVSAVVARHEPIARFGGVALHVSVPDSPVVVPVHARLFERALGNLVDNAVRYNRPGGRVEVELRKRTDGGFVVRVGDTGRGVSDEEFKGLTAIRRFRGDEGRTQRPGAPGLGLAVAREIADRSGLALDLARPTTGGFEASLRPVEPQRKADRT